MLDFHIAHMTVTGVDHSEQLTRIEKKLDELSAIVSQDQIDRQSLADSLRVFQTNNDSLKATREAVENAGS